MHRPSHHFYVKLLAESENRIQRKYLECIHFHSGMQWVPSPAHNTYLGGENNNKWKKKTEKMWEKIKGCKFLAHCVSLHGFTQGDKWWGIAHSERIEVGTVISHRPDSKASWINATLLWSGERFAACCSLRRLQTTSTRGNKTISLLVDARLGWRWSWSINGNFETFPWIDIKDHFKRTTNTRYIVHEYWIRCFNPLMYNKVMWVCCTIYHLNAFETQ